MSKKSLVRLSVVRSQSNIPQHEPLLPHISVLVPLPHHRALLRRGVAVHWVPGHVHAHWKLYLFADGLDRLDLPDHHDLPYHVSLPQKLERSFTNHLKCCLRPRSQQVQRQWPERQRGCQGFRFHVDRCGLPAACMHVLLHGWCCRTQGEGIQWP